MATPPLAVPSSLVKMMPVTPQAAANSRAWFSPFCPVVASSTSSVSRLQPGASRSSTRSILASSSIRFFLVCRRPAVSQMSTSTFLALAAVMLSYTTAAGSAPSACFIIWQPTRSAQTPSCSPAAARKVSAAPSSTFLPSRASPTPRFSQASLPMEVVLPTPLTPTTSTTLGLVSVTSGSSGSISSVTISQRFSRSSVESMFRRLMRSPSREQILPAVVTPTSARMRISSSSSRVS